MELGPLLVDLEAESADLDRLVAPLADEEWSTPTPAVGWTIAHQVAHLAWTDRAAAIAASDPSEFSVLVESAMAEPEAFVDRAAEAEASEEPIVILQSWRSGRQTLARALASVPDGTRVPWFGPPMSAASMTTARLMETWAHGQDVADALGVQRLPTDRLRHVAHISVRARAFAYRVHGRVVPDAEVRVELTSPSGDLWTWGPDDADQVITGSALDFCLLSTRRRHRADLDLRAVGVDAETWLQIAQAFAGPPGGGRPPLATS